MPERRHFPRVPFVALLKITHRDFGEKLVNTQNISDGGLYILTEPTDMPAIGEFVTGQIQGMPEEAPIMQLEIVRTENDGVGLRFAREHNNSR